MNKKEEPIDDQQKGKVTQIKDLNTGNYCEVGEDSTKYGEFISSYFAWISLPKQKERAEDLENMTKEEHKK